jgi:hypothetical protein
VARPLRRPLHRVRQFAGALRPRVAAPDRAEAYGWLSPAEQRLFETMTLRDQKHGIEVFRRVSAGAPAPDATLFAAALLHDCGKGRVALWQRVLHVLLGALAPGLRGRIAIAGAGWRGAMYRLLHHPRLGAALAERAGAAPDVVRIIREQESPAPDARLALLQAADEA